PPTFRPRTVKESAPDTATLVTVKLTLWASAPLVANRSANAAGATAVVQIKGTQVLVFTAFLSRSAFSRFGSNFLSPSRFSAQRNKGFRRLTTPVRPGRARLVREKSVLFCQTATEHCLVA